MKFNVDVIRQKVQPVANKISENRYLQAIMGGMMAALPVTIIGSLAALLKQLPIEPYQRFITSNGIDQFLQVPVNFTTNFLAVIFVIAIAFSLAQSFDIKGISPALVALVSFFILTPLKINTGDYGPVGVIPMDWLGATGIFAAILVAMIATRLYVYIVNKGWTIKMPDSVPPFIKDSFASLIPGIVIVFTFVIISALFASTSYGSLHQFVYTLLQTPLQQLTGNIGAIILVSIIGQILWFFGIHGSLVVMSVMAPIWGALDVAQLSAYSAGEELPNIVGLNFFMVYTFGGTVLGLSLLMLMARSKRFKTMGKLSVIPAVFGITEPVIFGTPLILNPIFAIPFIFGNAISLTLAYVATISGLIPPLTGIGVPAGVPVVFQGLIMGNWQNALFQFALVFVWIGLWYPFYKIADKIAVEEESKDA